MNYTIPFIQPSYARFYEKHKDELMAAFDSCMSRGALVLRDEVSQFEDTLARYVGTKYAVGVGSGTDALFLSLAALGIKGNWDYLLKRVYAGEMSLPEAEAAFEGDEVITVSHTFIASIQAIVHNGARPVLVDVGSDELMNPDLLEAAITPRTKAILPVHFHGKVCDMDRILDIAERYNLKVVEDAAQALGSSFNGQKAGSMGDLGCFSFNTPKLMGAWGDAGGIVTDNRELAEKLYLLRNHWNMAQTSVRMADFPTPEVVRWAWKSRIDNIQAAMLNVKFKHYDDLLARRREIADKYVIGLKDLPLGLPEYSSEDVIQEFIIRIGSDEERQRFKMHMDVKGIELLIRETTPNHLVEDLFLDEFSLPVTESISKDACRLPAYPELTDEEVDRVIAAIREFYEK